MKKKLSQSKFRTILTEVLPYERPLFYSNKFFARLLKRYDVRAEGNRLVAHRHAGQQGLSELLGLISGSEEDKTNYNYRISKDGVNEGRLLTVMHPFHQVMAMDFYDRYDQLIIAFCNKSKFSLRKPSKVSSMMKWSPRFDKLFSDDANDEISQESAKSYFCYAEFNNIAKFYGSFRYLNLEKNYDYLLKADIKCCFDSIAPETLARLVYGNGIPSSDPSTTDDFIYDFIRFHKEIRKGLPEKEVTEEDPGIIIGPEVSRLFAEIFMQQLDKRVEEVMYIKHKKESPRDYVFFRYVDDSFIAANSKEDLQLIMQAYSSVLKSVNMNLNDKKLQVYSERPFIDRLSLIKSRLEDLIERTFENRLETFRGFKKMQDGNYDAPTNLSFKRFISEFRVIVAETAFKPGDKYVDSDFAEIKCHSKYKDITSFALGVMTSKLLSLLEDFNNLYREYSQGSEFGYITDKGEKIRNSYETEFLEFCEELTESLFFILGSDLRMPTSISVVRILDIIQRFVRGKYEFSGKIKSPKFKSCLISDIDEKISKETVKLLRHKRLPGRHGLMEILNLLELQYQMFPRNLISEKVIIEFLETNEAHCQFHFFTVFQLIHFTRGSSRYWDIYTYVGCWIQKELRIFQESHGSDTESLLTVLELLSMPSDHQLIRQMPDIGQMISESEDLMKIRQFLDRCRSAFHYRKDYSVAEELEQRKGLNVY